jgi:hypothetical protein
MRTMTGSAAMPSKPSSRQTDSGDQQALAQVEKWMAVIRELGHEPAGGTMSAGARLERLLAPAAE